MLRVAFASTDQVHVDLHFGAAERFVVYDVSPGEAELVGIGEFTPALMTGQNRFQHLTEDQVVPVPFESMYPSPEELQKPPEDKVVAKLEFLQGCGAIYAASIGTSSIKRLMVAGIQPIIVDHGHLIVDLLNDVSRALTRGGVAWVERAVAQPKTTDRFAGMAERGWGGAGMQP